MPRDDRDWWAGLLTSASSSIEWGSMTWVSYSELLMAIIDQHVVLWSSMTYALPIQSWHSRLLTYGKAHSDGEMDKERDKLLAQGGFCGLGACKLLKLWIILEGKYKLSVPTGGSLWSNGSGRVPNICLVQSMGNIALGREKGIPLRCPHEQLLSSLQISLSFPTPAWLLCCSPARTALWQA